jgi:hypothetical protein
VFSTAGIFQIYFFFSYLILFYILLCTVEVVDDCLPICTFTPWSVVSVVFRWHEVGFSSLASHFYCLFFDHLSVCLPFIDRTMWDYFIVIPWRPSSINFSHFHLLFENHWTESPMAEIFFTTFNTTSTCETSCVGPHREHLCKVWLNSVQWFSKRRWKCEYTKQSYSEVTPWSVVSVVFRWHRF